VAQRLMDRLLTHARAQQVHNLMLGTTEHFHAAHRFYERNGFSEIARESLPSHWPRNSVDVKFYRLDLA
jgi:GNAT superfamily N-acetyltransferase